MIDYPTQLQLWSNFFSATAQVSGGLVGLVFVALTFKPEAMGVDGDAGLRKLARQTFADFINVLLVSLMMLVPYSGVQISLSLAMIGAIGLHRVLRSVWAVVRLTEMQRRGKMLLRFWLSFLGNVAIFTAGAGTALNRISDQIFWTLVFASLILLLISGARSAWILLMHDSGED